MEKQRNGWAKHVPLQVRPAARSDTSTAPNSVGPADPHTSHTKEVARREQREFLSKNLWEHVRSLPEIERRVVELRTREEKTFAQVAQGLGLKDGEQAQYHYWKALQRLRGKLREM
jgi:DNA-directed RNA polymerase specialized sigma subunit